MYNNDGYFCCQKGKIGYATTRHSNGCASAGHHFEENDQTLQIEKQVRSGESFPPNQFSFLSSPSKPLIYPPPLCLFRCPS